MNHHAPTGLRHSRGFTLVELLASVGITSVLLVVLATIVTHTTDGYAMSQRSVNQLSQTRALLQLLDSELSIRLPDTPLMSLPDGENAMLATDKLLFVRTLPADERQAGLEDDIATSCYYVRFVENADGQIVPRLFRKILNPSETQAMIEAGSDWKFPELDPTKDEPVVDGVVGFDVKPMCLDPETGSDKPWSPAIGHEPAYLEIMICTIDEAMSRRIKSPSEWHRVATAPQDGERQFIHKVSHKLSVSK